MNKYWHLTTSVYRAKDKWILSFADNWLHPLIEMFDFVKRDYTEIISLKTLRKGNPVDFNLGHDVPFVTKKLGELLQKYGDKNVERIPVMIENSEFKYGDYEIIKIYVRLDCVDLEKSVYKIFDYPGHPRHGEIAYLSKVKLDSSKIGEHHIFRIKQIDNLNESIFVSDELKQEIEKQGFTGVRFVRV